MKRQVCPARCSEEADGKFTEAPRASAGDAQQGKQGHGAPRADRGSHALARRHQGHPARGATPRRRHPCGDRRTSTGHGSTRPDTLTFAGHFAGQARHCDRPRGPPGMPTCPSTALNPGRGQGGRARPQKPRPTAPETRRRARAADAPVRAPAARSAAAGQSTLPTASTPAARSQPRGHGPAPPPQSGHAASPRCPKPRTFQLSSGRFFHPKALCPHPRAATPAMIQPLSRGLAGAGGLRPLGPSLRGWGQLPRGGPLALASPSHVQPSGEPRLHPAQGTAWLPCRCGQRSLPPGAKAPGPRGAHTRDNL